MIFRRDNEEIPLEPINMITSSATRRGRGRPHTRTPTNTQADVEPNLAHKLVRLIRSVIPTILEDQRNKSSRSTVVTRKHGSYKVFISVNLPEFHGEAYRIKREEIVRIMTWGVCKGYFLEGYCPQSLLDALEERFVHLTHRWLTVTEYENMLIKLYRFAKYLMAAEIMKEKRFVAG
uniref:Uncharacterized protein n=1 Tax=Tanacetum cinerariifolium TaxID=118510 RepID=A0A699HF33_TANCI|nr:hypothetical protein [Tanacetum cinerariifolium]